MKASVLRSHQVVFSGTLVLFTVHAMPAWSQAIPCIDTSSQTQFIRRTMVIQQPGASEITITGALASLNPATGEVALQIPGRDDEQKIKPKLIRLNSNAIDVSNTASQFAMPVKSDRGAFFHEYRLSELRVADGIINFPHCRIIKAHDVAFVGNLEFRADKVKIQGHFYDYTFPVEPRRPGIARGKAG
jgi:hypothetical protein